MRTIVALSQPISKAQADKLDSFALAFNKAMRQMYVDLVVHKKPQHPVENACIVHHNLNARHAKSIRVAVLGKSKSVLELNKEYLEIANNQLKVLQKKLKAQAKKISDFSVVDKQNLKPGDNLLLATQEKIRESYKYAQKKETHLLQKISRLNTSIKDGNPHLCFGTKKLLKQRTTGYFKTHETWLEEWRFQRNKEVHFVGSSDETAGNSNAQIRHLKDNDFVLKLNINPKASSVQEKYVELFFTLDYEAEAIKKIVSNNLLGKDELGQNVRQALTYRITKEKDSKKRVNQYKVAITFDKHKYNVPKTNDVMSGCIGVDINQEHLAICETNHQGNYVASWRKDFDASGTSHQNINSIALSVKNLIAIAKAKNKPIVMEKLDFAKKKQALEAGIHKKRNVQLSSFSYNKVKSLIVARAQDANIEVIEVNPAYTSVIGKAKYSKRLGISVHKAASYAIARRGMKIEEKEKVFPMSMSQSARNGLESVEGNAFWAKAQKLMIKETVRPGRNKVKAPLSPYSQQQQ